MLAGLLYLGSGIGLGVYRLIRRAPRVRLERHDLLPLTGAVFFGGVVGPVLLMFGLVGMPASGASLLLNAEGVATALLAWFVFAPQCISTIAVTRRETNGWKWPAFMVGYLFILAYAAAGLTYWVAVAFGLG